eukprot:m.83443 g.83443  ORF g.83443 m.83443 type:complete len:80 (-) comp19636_c2_seq1:136-375(-)
MALDRSTTLTQWPPTVTRTHGRTLSQVNHFYGSTKLHFVPLLSSRCSRTPGSHPSASATAARSDESSRLDSTHVLHSVN